MTDQPQQPTQPVTGFRTGHEMREAMKASRHKYGYKHGAWNKDPDLMARIEATPLHIQQEI